MKELNEEKTLYNNLCNSEGKIDELKLKEFIKEVLQMRDNVSGVYDFVTRGLLKKYHYNSEVVINIVKDLQKDLIDKNVICEDILNIVSDEGTKQLIQEYFGKY